VNQNRKENNKAPNPANNYWQVFERNGSIGAFLMFHQTKAQIRAAKKNNKKSSSRG